jgi:hypothetical protein
MMIKIDRVVATRYVRWAGGKNPSFTQHLKAWVEAGTVKLKIKATPRVADRGVQCMFVGYAVNHDGDCYRMWDPNMSRIHETRDIIWLRCMFFQHKLPATDLTMDPIEFSAPDSGAREGVDNNIDENQSDKEEKDDDKMVAGEPLWKQL